VLLMLDVPTASARTESSSDGVAYSADVHRTLTGSVRVRVASQDFLVESRTRSGRIREREELHRKVRRFCKALVNE
jgi:hypothetical protein